nr:MurR/RpiR family transcriptional regulator [uncultured Eisenbergiella sp.]
MNKDNFILQIKAAYNQFTKAETKVADYVLENQEKVLYMSITELADACEVGDASVYRFCRTMKLKGYQEFKMKVSLCQAASETAGKEGREGEKDSFAAAAERIMKQHTDAIRETCMLLERDSFLKVLSMFEHAGHVYFFGIGDSLLTAEEARNKFLRLTNKVSCITDPHMQAMAASLCTEKDLILIISYSGATKDNIHVAKLAREAGAGIVCITHFRKSPLTEYSDAVLLCGSNEAPLEGGSMKAKMSQLYLVDLLYQEYYERNFEACKHNNEVTSRSVVEKLF